MRILISALNSRSAPKAHRPKEAQAIEDLVEAYGFSQKHPLSERNVLRAHGILSRTFVSPTRQGVYRREPVGVYSRHGLAYVALEPYFVQQEMQALFQIIKDLLAAKSSLPERFFWATWLHLMMALIHPFSDGNGRISRLCEKWFLAESLGVPFFSLQSEEQYWVQRPQYYAALKLGANYWETDMREVFSFFALLPEGLRQVS
jgi:Fic family protein